MPHEVSDKVDYSFVYHNVEGMDMPGRIDIIERFGVCMDNDWKRIPEGRADGYFGLWHNDAMIGVWYFTIVDGLVGPKRAHLLDWSAMFKDLQQTLAAYMPPDYYLDGCRVRAGCAPHLTNYQPGSTSTIILF